MAELEQRAVELERMGFEVARDEDRVLAVRSQFRWDLMFSWVVAAVWLLRVERLTLERIEADLAAMPERWPTLDPSAWPPGLQKARLALITYVADAVDDDAAERLRRGAHLTGFGTATLVTAWCGNTSYTYAQRPIVGLILWEVLEGLHLRMALPPRGSAAGTSATGAVLSAVTGAFIAMGLIGVVFLLVSLGLVVLGVVVGTVVALMG